MKNIFGEMGHSLLMGMMPPYQRRVFIAIDTFRAQMMAVGVPESCVSGIVSEIRHAARETLRNPIDFMEDCFGRLKQMAYRGDSAEHMVIWSQSLPNELFAQETDEWFRERHGLEPSWPGGPGVRYGEDGYSGPNALY